MVEGSTPFYSLSNYGGKRNCTLTSMTPSVVTLRAINVGTEHETVNYDVSFWGTLCLVFININSIWHISISIFSDVFTKDPNFNGVYSHVSFFSV